MAANSTLGEFEQLVLLAILRVGEAAYAVPIRRELECTTGRDVSRGAVYITLDRLEQKGYLESWHGDPDQKRGGRPKRYYRPQPLALAALRHSRQVLLRMWDGLEPLLGES